MARNSYKRRYERIRKDMLKLIKKHNISVEEGTDHFATFFAQWIMESSDNALMDSHNFAHSFSRYIMAIEFDRKNFKPDHQKQPKDRVSED